METHMEDIPVMYLSAEGGSEGAQAAFTRLEAILPSLRGRKIYGVFHAGEYRACTSILADDDPVVLGLETWTITGGSYVRRKIKYWRSRIPEISKSFMALAEQYPADPDRPRIEFYRSQDELFLYLPILGTAATST